ncbi:maleylpyruvate isomerase family mycothiol-dependent enzyme [Actinoplanes subtropicus]|uniref:maleylpyruvate isomerase family mycothiol-dependent enzyme n=1 Tax=Actinoplanes subtropicus TaxID=543632 RepID=UPI0006892A3F|nr:maleylpyruvate isomerase family mycothiol-dependent enzyme [Actinoplanes subtropicus]
MDWLSPRRYADEMEAETARLAAAAAQRPTDGKIETCPEWTVRDLVTHVGTGHRLAAGIIEERRDRPAEYRLIAAPDEPADWPAWLAEGARRLNAAVDDLGFDGRVWSWQPKHQTAGFWQRRMLHDLIVHRFDADPAGDLAPDLAADGIADLLLALGYFPRFKGAGESLLFTATDTGQSWHVTLTPNGLAWQTNAQKSKAQKSAAEINAPARDLLLILNRRREPADIEGDRALWQRWREEARF